MKEPQLSVGMEIILANGVCNELFQTGKTFACVKSTVYPSDYVYAFINPKSLILQNQFEQAGMHERCFFGKEVHPVAVFRIKSLKS